MRLTILNVAYPLAPVGPDAVGGAEQVLTAIDSALAQSGHDSVVLACEGSFNHGELVTTPQVQGTLHGHMHAETQARLTREIQRLVAERGIDLVHLHGVD